MYKNMENSNGNIGCPFYIINLMKAGLTEVAETFAREQISCEHVRECFDLVYSLVKTMKLSNDEIISLQIIANNCQHVGPSSSSSSGAIDKFENCEWVKDNGNLYGQLKLFRISMFQFDDIQVNPMTAHKHTYASVADDIFRQMSEYFEKAIPPTFLKMICAGILIKYPFLDDHSEFGFDSIFKKVHNKFRYKNRNGSTQQQTAPLPQSKISSSSKVKK